MDKIQVSKHNQTPTGQGIACKKDPPLVSVMLLSKASKIEMIRAFARLTMPELLGGQYPSLFKLKKDHGVELTERMVAVLCHDLSGSFDGELSEAHVAEIGVELTSGQLGHISLEGMMMTFQQIKRTKQFGKLTLNKVLTALHQHLDDRTNAAIERNYNAHLAGKFVGERTSDERAKEDVDYRRFKADRMRENLLATVDVKNKK